MIVTVMLKGGLSENIGMRFSAVLFLFAAFFFKHKIAFLSLLPLD